MVCGQGLLGAKKTRANGSPLDQTQTNFRGFRRRGSAERFKCHLRDLDLLFAPTFSRPVFSTSAVHLPEKRLKNGWLRTWTPKKSKALFRFWDSETDDARLVIENLQSADPLGGKALNYVACIGLKREASIWAIHLENRESNEKIWVRSKLVLNAAGPFVDEVRKLASPETSRSLVDRVEGAHIDVFPSITSESYYMTASDGRLVFVLRRKEDQLEYTRIGTTERTLSPTESSDSSKPTQEEIDYLMELANGFLSSAQIKEENILRVDSGIRPLVFQSIHSPFHKSREHRIVKEEGLYHIVGVKLTDYRRVAVEIVHQIPWEQYDIHPFPFEHSWQVPLRYEASDDLYFEKSPEDYVHRTMILHWSDYFNRRHGLTPRFLAKTNPQKLRETFEAMKSELRWNDDEFHKLM